MPLLGRKGLHRPQAARQVGGKISALLVLLLLLLPLLLPVGPSFVFCYLSLIYELWCFPSTWAEYRVLGRGLVANVQRKISATLDIYVQLIGRAEQGGTG